MKHYRMMAELLSPLIIRRERQSQRSEGASFIGGTLVRGAFAHLYRHYYGTNDSTFTKLFLHEDSCRYGPLDPGPSIFPLTASPSSRKHNPLVLL